MSDGNSPGRRARQLSARSPRHAEQLDAFAAELLRARCRLHSDLAVCDQCVAPRQLDSLGFPSAAVARDRGRYRLCPDCRKLFSVGEWVPRDAVLPVSRSCRGCSGDAPET